MFPVAYQHNHKYSVCTCTLCCDIYTEDCSPAVETSEFDDIMFMKPICGWQKENSNRHVITYRKGIPSYPSLVPSRAWELLPQNRPLWV